MSNGVVLFNPRSANYNHRIPNAILQIGAALDGEVDYEWVDGNRETNPLTKIEQFLASGNFDCLATSVMPGPQLRQAIPIAKAVKARFPQVKQVWGGYFASNQYQTVLNSGWIDAVIVGPGDLAFPQLLKAWRNEDDIGSIGNLAFLRYGQIVKTHKLPLMDLDLLPALPYQRLHERYSIPGYLAPTFLGKRTAAYHSSMGCPFTCSFCAVVPIFEAKWRGKSADKIVADLLFLQDQYGADAVEFHDNNFFVSQKRIKAFSKGIRHANLAWWGEGRIDTIDKYSDETLAEMREAGCRMIFFGAESGNDQTLKSMNKGGTQTAAQIKSFAKRIGRFDIIPEYSFVLGLPGPDEASVWRQIESDIAFIKEIKAINPATEIIIYVYSPVPTEGSELFNSVKKAGFYFPRNLEEWLNPAWENFDLRKNPLTPWLTTDMVQRILDFETVLHGRYPTVSDRKLTVLQRKTMALISSWRYRTGWYRAPRELRWLQHHWLRYRQPEIEGF